MTAPTYGVATPRDIDTPMIIGQSFLNGHEAHSIGFDWRAALVVVSIDRRSYGVTRYRVRNAHGRHGWAY